MSQNIETTNATPPAQPKKFLDRLRGELELRHCSFLTEQSYVGWTRRYIPFRQQRHSQDMGAAEVRTSLEHLATERGVTASTRSQALNALVFLYKNGPRARAGASRGRSTEGTEPGTPGGSHHSGRAELGRQLRPSMVLTRSAEADRLSSPVAILVAEKECCLIRRGLPGTAVRGPACTVVWEAGGEIAPPTRFGLWLIGAGSPNSGFCGGAAAPGSSPLIRFPGKEDDTERMGNWHASARRKPSGNGEDFR